MLRVRLSVCMLVTLMHCAKTGQTDGQTGGRTPGRYITLSAGRRQRKNGRYASRTLHEMRRTVYITEKSKSVPAVIYDYVIQHIEATLR